MYIMILTLFITFRQFSKLNFQLNSYVEDGKNTSQEQRENFELFSDGVDAACCFIWKV